MKLSEFFELYWDGRSIQKQKALLAEQPPEFRIVWGIHNDFTDRRGLRQQWEEIDDDIRDEIFDAWVKIARAAGNENGEQK